MSSNAAGDRRSAAATISIVGEIAAIPADDWDRLANPEATSHNPFVSHAFLHALEASGSVGEDSGWHPRHITLEEAGRLRGVMPAYLKTHSQGEYVFDHAWADAYHRAGGRYYPKLQCAVPFTPVPGPRLLVDPGEDASACEDALIKGALWLVRETNASSLHITFADEALTDRLAARGFLHRIGQQFHFENPGYTSFDDFLGELASRKRKAIRKERTEALREGLVVRHLTGSDIREKDWDAFFAFYMDTGDRKWGRPYLNRRFFSLLGEKMAGRCLLVFAERNGRPVAGALNLIGGDCLFGRYWGAKEQYPFLHFELCYYQAIEFAIAHKLSRVEAGAQGEHKLARGYRPVATHSAHFILDSGLRSAVARYLDHEREAITEVNAELDELTPFRKGQSSPPVPED